MFRDYHYTMQALLSKLRRICYRFVRAYNNQIWHYLRKKMKRDNQHMFNNYFDKIIKQNNFGLNMSQDSAFDQWTTLWGSFGMPPSKKLYSVYSRYIEDTINIVPNEVARNYIEPILTPYQYQPFYNDKNSFDLFIGREFMPQTLFRSMNGHLLDSDYELINEDEVRNKLNDIDRFIVKPTLDMGGRGIALFQKKDGLFVDSKGDVFSLNLLIEQYNTNYIVQKCIDQSDFMSQFNATSVNTIRIATYRDVETGVVSVIGAVLRIGGSNSVVDNACSGGVFVSVDSDGRLGKYVCNQYAQKYSVHNGINFETNDFRIPDYDGVKNFVIKIAKRFPHMSLFANDIAITKDGSPILIEVNTQQFSYWLYQFCGNTVFGERTTKLIEHCVKQQSGIKVNVSTTYSYK